MVDKISDKIGLTDVVYCVPGIGTLVGLVESTYHLVRLIAPKERDHSNHAHNLIRQANALHQEARVLMANQNTAGAAQKLTSASGALDSARTAIHMQRTATDKKTDFHAKKCFESVLKATWLGAIGLLAYKLFKA